MDVRKNPDGGYVSMATGEAQSIPADWEFLPSGDPFVTRRVKAGSHFVEKAFSRARKRWEVRGVWGPAASISAARVAAEETASDRARRRVANQVSRRRRERQNAAAFEQACFDFLALAPEHQALAREIAKEVTQHATEVGSGRVGRSGRSPLPNYEAEDAELAGIIAPWDEDERRQRRSAAHREVDGWLAAHRRPRA